MDTIAIKSAFVGLDEETLDLCVRDLKDDLIQAFSNLRADLLKNNKTSADLAPPIDKIFTAFIYTPVDKIRVIILGQDPYINPGEADGLAFSTNAEKTPPSLRNIFKCLIYNNFIQDYPASNSLTAWCKQGVLLLNTSLTTYMHQSNSHKRIWRNYIDKLIIELSARKQNLAWILLGNEAQKKAPLINNRHSILTWGHPSSLNLDNRNEDNLKHFKYCNVFNRTNELFAAIGKPPINWSLAVDARDNGSGQSSDLHECEPLPNDDACMYVTNPTNTAATTDDITNITANTNIAVTTNIATTTYDVPLPTIPPDAVSNYTPTDTIYVFTDGGAIGNGKPTCRASWAYCVYGNPIAENSGLVQKVRIPGKKYQTSNQRAELTAILEAMKYIIPIADKQITIVSDSEYSINCITLWYPKWSIHDRKTRENLDILDQINDLYNDSEQTICFKHVRSHKSPPTDEYQKFLWTYNDRVDKLCTAALRASSA